MHTLGKINILLLNDKYSIQFKYSNPRMIDFFELMLMEIIKHKDNFTEQSMEQILLMLEIPNNLHFFYERRLKDFINNSPKLLESRNDISDNTKFLSRPPSSFLLTQLGDEAFTSKEIVEDPSFVTDEYIYESTSKDLLKKITEDPQNENNAVVLNMCTLDSSNVNDTFTSIIMEKPKKYIANVSSKTKIFELEAAHTGTAFLKDNINVSIDNGKIKYNNSNEKILKAFLNASPQEKEQLRTKQIFNYLNITQTKINFDRAKFAVVRKNPIKLKIAFGEASAIEAIADAVTVFPINSDDLVELRKEINFCFAGIDTFDRSIVYNYCEIDGVGYTIPLEEEDYTSQSYDKIYRAVYSYSNRIDFAILACLPKDKKDFVLQVIKDNLVKEKINADKVIDLMKEYDLPKDEMIKILAENSPKTNRTINTLLAIDEATTKRIYKLEEMYNSLLKEGKISEISHNTNLYAYFADYEKQYKKLQMMGLHNYYEYSTPKDWDIFMEEVYNLREKFERIKTNLDIVIVKQAVDFFESIQEYYNTITPVNEKVIKQLLEKDLEKEINKSGFDTVIIASAIRYKYDEYLRKIEKVKDPKANGSRKGRMLIDFTVDKKLAEITYQHWRNLCTLVHKSTAKNSKLWKGNEQDRQKILSAALYFFNSNFAIKEE